MGALREMELMYRTIAAARGERGELLVGDAVVTTGAAVGRRVGIQVGDGYVGASVGSHVGIAVGVIG